MNDKELISQSALSHSFPPIRKCDQGFALRKEAAKQKKTRSFQPADVSISILD
jgi:hypothetical protein